MARRHFDNKGFPKLKQIIKEICEYVVGLEIEYTDYLKGNVIDTQNKKYGERVVHTDVEFVQGLSKRPFKVNAIYVVGGQVSYLPDSYNTGEHDLDLIMNTNADAVTFPSEMGVDRVEMSIWGNLTEILNNGKGDISQQSTKEFLLDLFMEHEEGKLKSPYLQIYPTIERVSSN